MHSGDDGNDEAATNLAKSITSDNLQHKVSIVSLHIHGKLLYSVDDGSDEAAANLVKPIVSHAMTMHGVTATQNDSINDDDKVGKFDDTMVADNTFLMCKPVVVGPRGVRCTVAAATVAPNLRTIMMGASTNPFMQAAEDLELNPTPITTIENKKWGIGWGDAIEAPAGEKCDVKRLRRDSNPQPLVPTTNALPLRSSLTSIGNAREVRHKKGNRQGTRPARTFNRRKITQGAQLGRNQTEGETPKGIGWDEIE